MPLLSNIYLIFFIISFLVIFSNKTEPSNQRYISEFLLTGLTCAPEAQPLIFSFFLTMYFVTILGNLLIILAVSSDSRLHTPMYFFLSNLSFTDICISTTTLPKMLLAIQAQDQSITYTGCISQAGLVFLFGGFESSLLAVMAYDRYVAICHPLRYTVLMDPCLCVGLVLFSLVISTMNALLHGLMLLRLSFCIDWEVPNFFCELTQVIKLACSDTFINTLLIFTVSTVFAGVPFIGVIFSYTHIVSSILRISSAGGRQKAFSTCGSHLSVVSLFYGTAFGVHLSSAVNDSAIKNVVSSMMYIVVPQMLNPFIYSLRNREMKQALKQLIVGRPVVTSPP